MIEAAPNTFVVLPVKDLDRAKQRLSESIGDQDRRRLAMAMLEDVLTALDEVRMIFGVVVVTSDPEALGIAERHGCKVVGGAGSDEGHSEAALTGIAEAVANGAERVLLLPGDCPLLNPREVDRLLSSLPETCVAIVPDRHGTGTNALLLSPPDAIDPAFGEGSADRHRRLAREAGVPAAIEELPSLALDLDTPADLVALTTRLEAGAGGAGQTAKALGIK